MSRRTFAAAVALAVVATMTTTLGVASAEDPTLVLSPDKSTTPLVFDATTMSGTLPGCASHDMFGGPVAGPFVQLMLGTADEAGAYSFSMNVYAMLGDYFDNPPGVLVPPGSYPMTVGCVQEPFNVVESDIVNYSVPAPPTAPDDTTSPSVSGPLDLTPGVVPVGGSVDIHADGYLWDPIYFAAFSVVLYVDGAAPQVLTQGYADGDGHIDTQVTIPAGTPRGTHRLVLYGNTHELVPGEPPSGGVGGGGSFIVHNGGLKILAGDIEVTCPMGPVSAAAADTSGQLLRPSAGAVADTVDDLICDVVAPIEETLAVP